MKLATLRKDSGSCVAAIVQDGGRLIDLQQAALEAGDRPDLFGDMIAFLESGGEGRTLAGRLIDHGLAEGRGRAFRMEELQAPVPCPRKLFCVAGNYLEHIEEGGGVAAPQDKETPRIFMKPPSSTVVGPGGEIRISPVAQAVDWEGELAVVMGRRVKAVKADRALDHVAGYTIMNDVSERELKIWGRSESRTEDSFFDWLNGKWYDTFAPMGPWLVTTEDIPNPQALQISTYVNQERKQHCSTAQMIFPVAMIIEYLSAMVTLEPGDVISTGTVAGVGAVSGQYLRPGDQVRVEVSEIGQLDNRVVGSPD